MSSSPNCIIRKSFWGGHLVYKRYKQLVKGIDIIGDCSRDILCFVYYMVL